MTMLTLVTSITHASLAMGRKVVAMELPLPWYLQLVTEIHTEMRWTGAISFRAPITYQNVKYWWSNRSGMRIDFATQDGE